jgi:hypothetical protein
VAPLVNAGADVLMLRGGGGGGGGAAFDPDDPNMMQSAMATVIATGADPGLIDLLVSRGARRPTLLERPHAFGSHIYVSPTGKEIDVVDIRKIASGGRVGGAVMDMRSKSDGAGGDERLARLMCSFPACAKPPEFGKSLQVCGRCKMAAYCNVECQRGHWKTHKAECKERKDVSGTRA